jgi:DNA polymerase delta subunit 1
MLVDIQKSGYRSDSIRLFGTTADGSSVLVEIQDFHNWLYVDLQIDDPQKRVKVQQHLAQIAKGIKADMVRSCYSYTSEEKQMIRLTLNSTKFDQKRIVELLDCHCKGEYVIYDDLDVVMQYLCETNISGGAWVTVAPNKIVPATSLASKTTTDITVNASWKDITCDSSRVDIAPMRILSFDIECQGTRKDKNGWWIFVDPQFDPICTIGNYVYIQGKSEPVRKIAFQWKETSADGVDGEVKWFKNEADMILAWCAFVRNYDFDVLMTYNGTQFDFPYLYNRAEQLGISLDLARDGSRVQCYKSRGGTKHTASRQQWKVSIPGRINLDVQVLAKANEKLKGYSLNFVATTYLDEQKMDLHYSLLNKLQDGTPEDRARIVKYCLRDCELPFRIVEKRLYFIRLIEMARVTGTPIEWLIHRGQATKASLQTRRNFRLDPSAHFIVPHHDADLSDDQYTGAIVIEPDVGFYDMVSTLDFNSLYPNIMRYLNLCYKTHIPKFDLDKVDPDKYIVSKSGEAWTKPEVCAGILPGILTTLLDARKRAKDDLKAEKDPFKRTVFDARQLALKITANSIYGFTGAKTADMPKLEIASAVTAQGRHMIMRSKEIVETHFTIANGYKGNARVVYGDTDSVMIHWGGGVTLDETATLSKEACDLINREFPRPNCIVFEKTFKTYLLINKKRYSGYKCVLQDDGSWKMFLDSSGLETERRDNCQLLRDTLNQCLHIMCVEGDADRALEFAKEECVRLIEGRVPIDELVITMEYKNHWATYKSPNAVASLAKRVETRPGSQPYQPGDRVAYVTVIKGKGTKIADCAEDPLWALKHKMEIDYMWYLTNQLAKPLYRIFQFKSGITEKFFTDGPHIRQAKRPQVMITQKTGLFAMLKPKPKCMICHGTIQDGRVCDKAECKAKEQTVMDEKIAAARKIRAEQSGMWQFCRNCAGDQESALACINRECPKFFTRHVLDNELDEASGRLKMINVFDW